MTNEICPESAPLKVGEEFVRYQVRALIGYGDHAYVYDAYDPFLDRDVAIKVIPDPPNSQRDLVQRAMEQEAILRDLRHTNLASVFEVGTIGDNLVYVVMDRVKGQTLRQTLLERRVLSPLEVANIGLLVAEGLAFAHSQLVIHRDLKPENIYILPNGDVKVINTGITSFIVPSGMVTERDRLRGTLLYMSPEHIQGFGVTDSCDMYSLGTVMYECSTGSPPVLIGSDSLTLDDVVWRQVAHMPPQLDDIVPAMPRYLARTIQQMLAKEAVLRFATMEEVATRLREALRRIKAGDDQPESEPKKASAGRIPIAPALDISTPEQAAAAVRVIAKNAAELDVGVNSRCPPSMPPEDEAPPTMHRRALLATAICIGSIAGLGIAVYKAEADNRAPEQPRASATVPQFEAVRVPPLGEPPAIAHAATGPSDTKARGGGLEKSDKSTDYDVARSPTAPSASTPRQPVVNPVAQAKSKRPHAGELIF